MWCQRKTAAAILPLFLIGWMTGPTDALTTFGKSVTVGPTVAPTLPPREYFKRVTLFQSTYNRLLTIRLLLLEPRERFKRDTASLATEGTGGVCSQQKSDTPFWRVYLIIFPALPKKKKIHLHFSAPHKKKDSCFFVFYSF